LQAQIRAGMVADNPQLRQAMQQAPSSSESFASETDDSVETTGKLAVFSKSPGLSTCLQPISLLFMAALRSRC